MSRAFFDEVYRRYGDPVAFLKTVERQLAGLNLTQAKLAERAGVAPEQLSRWLSRRRETPKMESMLRLDEALEDLATEAAGE